MTNGLEQQVTQVRQQSAQTGFSGTAILDVHPSTGIIRLKVNSVPPEKLGEFIMNYTNILIMSLNAANINVKTHIAQDG
jgi:hypothetical protein